MRAILSASIIAVAASIGPASAHDNGHEHQGDAHHDEAEAHGHEAHEHDHGHDDEFADHKAEMDGLTILHAWAQATEGNSGRVFMEIENTGEATVLLTGGDAHGVAESVTLMASPIKAGDAPQALGEIDIAPGSEMDLVPTGLFLALDGLTEPLHQGESFEMHVELEPLGEVEITVEVEAADAKQHSHAGHTH